MKLLLAVGVAAALGLAATSVVACPCSDDAGGASLVRRDERYAAALVASSRRTLGRFDAFGRYRASASDELEASEELLLRGGLRLPSEVEWLGEVGASAYRFHAASVHQQHGGLGDASLRVRARIRGESMPHETWPLPSLTLAGLLRAPLGGINEERSRSFGSGGVQLGLGVWELGGGVEAARSLSTRLELLFASELAYRLPDDALGVRRRLGPRADLALGARAQPAAWLTASALLRARLVADVEVGGLRIPGTGERLWSLVLGAAVFEPKTRLRSSVSLSVDPPAPGFSRGATSTMALSVALGYGVR